MISVLDGVDAGDRNQTGIVLLHVLTVTTCVYCVGVRARVKTSSLWPSKWRTGVRIE